MTRRESEERTMPTFRPMTYEQWLDLNPQADASGCCPQCHGGGDLSGMDDEHELACYYCDGTGELGRYQYNRQVARDQQRWGRLHDNKEPTP